MYVLPHLTGMNFQLISVPPEHQRRCRYSRILVSSHIKEVTDKIATAGYLAIAPALFDRVKPNTTLKYDDEGVSRRQFEMRQISK